MQGSSAADTDLSHDLDDTPERPSKGIAVAMIVVGLLFLLPFIFLNLAAGPFFSLGAFVGALLTVGWTFGLGIVFLVFGWKRLRATGSDEF